MVKNSFCCDKKTRIDKVAVAENKLSSPAGLTFLVCYLEPIDIYQLLERYFGSIRQSAKGISEVEAFKCDIGCEKISPFSFLYACLYLRLGSLVIAFR